jgi:hypothetical protein
LTVSLKTTIEAFKDALSVNAALTAWAQAAYGRTQKIYVNIDVRKPPGEEDCPYIMLRPTAARYGRGLSEKTINIEMLCCLYDEEFVQDPETNAVEYFGIGNSMDMLDLAVAAIAAVSTGNALLQDVDAEFETIEFFPFFMAGCPITLVEPITLGAVRTTL